MEAAGAEQAAQMEKLLLRQKPAIRLSSGLWPRYLRGDVLPQGSLEGSRSSLVVRLDKIYPGTESIFNHPVWELLDFDRLLGPRDLKRLYLALGGEIFGELTLLPPGVEELVDYEKLSFWRARDENRSEVWKYLPDLDGIAVCLLEARLDYLAQDVGGFVQAMLGAGHEFIRLGKSPVFQDDKSRAALLLMEMMAQRYASCLVQDDPFMEDEFPDLCLQIDHWQESWNVRAQLHHAKPWEQRKFPFKYWVDKLKSRKYQSQ